MSSDTKWVIGTVIGTGLAIVTMGLTIAGFLFAAIGDVRTDIRRLDDRLRAVEIAFGKVDQRLATLERLHRPSPDPSD